MEMGREGWQLAGRRPTKLKSKVHKSRKYDFLFGDDEQKDNFLNRTVHTHTHPHIHSQRDTHTHAPARGARVGSKWKASWLQFLQPGQNENQLDDSWLGHSRYLKITKWIFGEGEGGGDGEIVALEMSSAWMKCRKSQNVTKLISNYVGYFVQQHLPAGLAKDLCYKTEPALGNMSVCIWSQNINLQLGSATRDLQHLKYTY